MGHYLSHIRIDWERGTQDIVMLACGDMLHNPSFYLYRLGFQPAQLKNKHNNLSIDMVVPTIDIRSDRRPSTLFVIATRILLSYLYMDEVNIR